MWHDSPSRFFNDSESRATMETPEFLRIRLLERFAVSPCGVCANMRAPCGNARLVQSNRFALTLGLRCANGMNSILRGIVRKKAVHGSEYSGFK